MVLMNEAVAAEREAMIARNVTSNTVLFDLGHQPHKSTDEISSTVLGIYIYIYSS